MFKYLFIVVLLFSGIALSTAGSIRVCNQGGYLAKCYLQTQSFSDELHLYRTDTGLFPVLQCSTLTIPYDVVWSQLECKALTFIATYSTIFTEEFSFGLLNLCYTITGTILDPTWSQTRC